MCEHYEALVEGGVPLLNRLSPHEPAGDHCPDAADAVNDYLGSGRIVPATAGAAVTYRISNAILRGFRRADLGELIRSIRESDGCRHWVVRATRTRPRDGEAAEHYFVLMGFRGRAFVADAYGHLLIEGRDRIFAYMQSLIGPCRVEATARFDVETDDPLSAIRDPLNDLL